MSVSKQLIDLEARLPELEWKINALAGALATFPLPKNLFCFRHSIEPSALIAEIRENMHALALQKTEASACYLAKRIHQKINVLVSLCRLQGNSLLEEKKNHFGLKRLSTRHQWMQNLEKEIDSLVKQQQSLQKTLSRMRSAEGALNLQAELGALERRLTLAREAYENALVS